MQENRACIKYYHDHNICKLWEVYAVLIYNICMYMYTQ